MLRIQSTLGDCLKALENGVCWMVADELVMSSILAPLFSLLRRCMTGMESMCEASRMPPALTPPPAIYKYEQLGDVDMYGYDLGKKVTCAAHSLS